MKKILYTIVILGGAIAFFLFSTPGLDILIKAPDSNSGGTCAPFMYYHIARMHESMGRYENAEEIYDKMLDVYGNLKSGEYVEHDLSKYYLPYTLYRKGICLKEMGDMEYNLATSGGDEEKEYETKENLALSKKHYKEARDVFSEFIDNYSHHKLYSDANRLYNELQTNLSS